MEEKKIEKTSCNISFRTQFIEIEIYKEIGKTSAVSRATDRQYLFYNEKDISISRYCLYFTSKPQTQER